MASASQGLHSSAQELYRRTRRAALAGFVVMLCLGVAKLLGGLFGHSLALLSDSLHSFGDALSSASVLVALWWSERPADLEHPYGHTRIETIAAINVAVALMLSGVWVAYESIRTWNEPSPTPHGYTLLIALASVAANEVMFRYSLSVAKATGSKSVEASAWDQRLDVMGSLVVLLSLVAVIWLGPGWHSIDHVAALIVAITILIAGSHIFWGGLQDLMDRQADPQVLAQIRKIALHVPGVLGVEKLFVRKSGLEYFVDIHVEVAPEISVREGHEIGHAVKDRLIAEMITVRDVLVHIEPFVGGR
jgi:cation diffusion facilitator family transporter